MGVSAPFARVLALSMLGLAMRTASAVSIAVPPPAAPRKQVVDAPVKPAEASHPTVAVEKKGMTWGVGTPVSADSNIVFVTCHGLPRVQGHSCDPYVGDTECSARLPLLCLNVDGRTRPPGLATPHAGGAFPDSFYSGWAAGRVALSEPVEGYAFKGRSDADAFCANELGPGWRVGEHHDGVDETGQHGGWGFVANGHVSAVSRFWVAGNGSPGNCWDQAR